MQNPVVTDLENKVATLHQMFDAHAAGVKNLDPALIMQIIMEIIQLFQGGHLKFPEVNVTPEEAKKMHEVLTQLHTDLPNIKTGTANLDINQIMQIVVQIINLFFPPKDNPNSNPTPSQSVKAQSGAKEQSSTEVKKG